MSIKEQWRKWAAGKAEAEAAALHNQYNYVTVANTTGPAQVSTTATGIIPSSITTGGTTGGHYTITSNVYAPGGVAQVPEKVDASRRLQRIRQLSEVLAREISELLLENGRELQRCDARVLLRVQRIGAWLRDKLVEVQRVVAGRFNAERLAQDQELAKQWVDAQGHPMYVSTSSTAYSYVNPWTQYAQQTIGGTAIPPSAGAPRAFYGLGAPPKPKSGK